MFPKQYGLGFGGWWSWNVARKHQKQGEICGGRNKNMRMALEGREPNQGGGLRYLGWSSRVFMFKPKGAFHGQLQGSARVPDSNQVERDLWV